jgi:hypothetical protein
MSWILGSIYAAGFAAMAVRVATRKMQPHEGEISPAETAVAATIAATAWPVVAAAWVALYGTIFAAEAAKAGRRLLTPPPAR